MAFFRRGGMKTEILVRQWAMLKLSTMKKKIVRFLMMCQAGVTPPD
jgi:hypothetical protein